MAAATLLTPLSVANKLNCAAAFLVSCISTLIPRELIHLLVCGEMGYVLAPKPRMRRSTVVSASLLYLRRWIEPRGVDGCYRETQGGFPKRVRIIPGFGHTRSSTPHASFCTSHWPFSFNILLFRSSPPLPNASHGRQLNASPATSKQPLPPPIFRPLSRWNPSLRQASMAVVGAGILPRTSKDPKSVCVSSCEGGPRSVMLGLLAWRLAFWDK